MIAETGERSKVRGRSKAIAATGPNPGKTPVNVPTNTPIKQKTRFKGFDAMINPFAIFSKNPNVVNPQEPAYMPKMPIGNCILSQYWKIK